MLPETPVVLREYVWGLDLSQSLQGAGGVGGLLAVRVNAEGESAVNYATYDANGNVSEYIDAVSGNVAGHYEYDAFGNLTRETGDNAGDFPHRFSTKYLDGQTTLYYYGFRFYSPELGRWLSRDPIGEEGAENIRRGQGRKQDQALLADTDVGQQGSEGDGKSQDLPMLYLFVNNNPILSIDPLGLCKIELRYKRLGKFLGRKFYHAYVVLTWEKGQQTYYRGGPSSVGTVGSIGEGGGWGGIYMNSDEYVEGSIDWTPDAPSLTVVDDDAPCYCYHQQLLASVDTINNLRVQYHPRGPNSNTAAHRLIYILIGKNPAPPVWAPAWDHPLR